LSRHRKVKLSRPKIKLSRPDIKLSRSKAVVIAAAGALSVATAASATAATWSQAPQGQAARTPHLAVTAQLARPVPEAARQDSDSSATLVQHAYRLRLAQAQAAIARRQAAKKAAERAARKAAAAAAARAAARAAASQARATAQPSQAASAAAAAPGSPRQIAQAMLGSFGWPASEFSCLDPLWAHESGWSVSAYNAGSGAFGIPQALPGSRMASAGPDWQTNPATQIKWGLEYIKGTYGSPCAAWAHSQATGWY
jgi:hypothetical protein